MAASGSFRLLGFPLRVDPGLLIVFVVVATSVHSTSGVLVAFIVGGLVSLVAHELGHAIVARSVGATGVSISLHSYGGLTRYVLPVGDRKRTALIAAAGPAVGLALGLCVWIADQAAAPAPGSEASAIYKQLLFVTVGWSILNLLPVVPLDGGRLMEQLLPGSAQDRARVAGVVSALTGAVACGWFWQRAAWYPAILFGVLAAFGVVYAILGTAPGTSHRHTPSCAVFATVCTGDYAGAAAAAQKINRLDPALAALLRAIINDDRAAQARLYQLNGQQPTDQMARSCLMVLRSRLGDWPGILAMLPRQNLKIGAFHAALRAAYNAGVFTEAATIGEALLRVRPSPTVAYNTACCWARAGNPDLALSALIRAVNYGWTDWARFDTDEDLASLRTTPAFRSWRTTLVVAA